MQLRKEDYDKLNWRQLPAVDAIQRTWTNTPGACQPNRSGFNSRGDVEFCWSQITDFEPLNDDYDMYTIAKEAKLIVSTVGEIFIFLKDDNYPSSTVVSCLVFLDLPQVMRQIMKFIT